MKAHILKEKISKKTIIYPKIPLKYQKGWHANSTRNLAGYITCGAGTIAALITTIYLRIFIF